MITEHIQIPFDEANIFNQEEQFHEVLQETLLLSTLGKMHVGKASSPITVVVTLKSIWFTISKKKQIPIEIKHITAVLRSFGYPQLVIITNELQDNIRISTSSMERCWYVISAISYTLSFKKLSLTTYSINQGSLDYFERTVKQKKKGHQVSLTKYPKEEITYLKPISNIKHIYGSMKIDKLILEKQLQIQDPNSDHLVYLAKVNGLDYYFCHYLPKFQSYIRPFFQHKNMEHVQSIKYVKATQYKMQIFLQHGQSIRGLNTPQIFMEMWKLYDFVKKLAPTFTITTDSFLIINEEVKVREFRYDFINQAQEIQKLRYENLQFERSYIEDKTYNLGLILYELTFGQNLFTHECLQTLIQIKKQFTQVIYPQYMDIGMKEQLRNFIQKCILMKFETEKEVLHHPWLTI